MKALDRSDRLDNDAQSVALKPDLSHNKTRCIVEYQLDTSDDQNKTNILVVSYYHHHYCYHFKYLNRYNDWLSLRLVNITFVKKTNTLVISYEVERDGEENELQVQTWRKTRKHQRFLKYIMKITEKVSGGHFVHFFVPENLPPMPKHVIFVLDSSRWTICWNGFDNISCLQIQTW